MKQGTVFMLRHAVAGFQVATKTGSNGGRLIPARRVAVALTLGIAVTLLLAADAPPAQLTIQPEAQPTTSPTTTSQPAEHPTTQLSLSFKDAPLDTVLDYLSESAGFVVVKEVPLDGRVTLVSRQPVTASEAVMLLDAVLRANGYTTVRQGRMLKIVAQDRAKKMGVPVHFGADPAAIDDADDLITQVIPVTNLDAVKLKQDLSAVIGADADVTANAGSNSIVITDTSSRIKRVVELISALDQHESGNFELRRYPLKNANAVAATKLIIGIFKPEDAGPRPPGAPKRDAQAGQPDGARGKITAAADERTNTVFVSAAADTLKIVEGVLKELDANPASVSAIKIFPLKYADASAAVKLLTAVFKPDDIRNPAAPPRPNAPDQALTAHVNVASDDRTNSVVVAAPTDTLTAIEGILTRLDADPSSVSELRVVPLVNADATETAKLVMSVFKPDDGKPVNPNLPPRPDQSLTKITAVADDRTNSVVVTAPTETLKAILDVLKTLDGNAATASSIKVFQLKYADATATVKLLTTIFKSDEAPNAPQGAPKVQGVTQQASKIKISAAADDRTNTVVVSAAGETMKVIEGIIKELDSNPASDASIFIYKLKNGQAADLEPVLNVVFGNPAGGYSGNQQNRGAQQLGGASAFGNGGASAFGGLGSSLGSQRSSGMFGASSGINNRPSYPAGRGAGGAGAIAPGLSLSPNSSRTASELTGQVSVVAEMDTNSLIVTTAAKYRDRVTQLIDELDRPVPQVLIKVLIAEVTHDNTDDLGMDFSVLNQRANGNGIKGGTNFGTAAAASTGGLVVSYMENNINITLHALATAGKLDVLSRPYILASDNQLASITVGQEVPFITDTRTTDLGQTINTIQYQDIGIILNVTPHINNEGLVILDVAPEISQLTGTTVPISEVVNAPVFAKRSAQSRVGIKDGQTIVIGGLMEDRKTSTVDKVPFLGDIPGLGLLFQHRHVTKSKTELLIFLTPHVAQQPDTLKPMSADEVKGTQLTPRAVAPGTFQDHMEGMQRGGVAPTTSPATQPVSIPTADPPPART